MSTVEQSSRRADQGLGAPPEARTTSLLLAAENAIDIGRRILVQGRSHMGSLVPKGDRDFATDVDLEIERAIRTFLAETWLGVRLQQC